MALSKLNIMSRLRSEFSAKQAGLLAEILHDIQADAAAVNVGLANVAAEVDTVGDGLNAVVAKLNLDAGVTDVDYATVTIDAAGAAAAVSVAETGI